MENKKSKLAKALFDFAKYVRDNEFDLDYQLAKDWCENNLHDGDDETIHDVILISKMNEPSEAFKLISSQFILTLRDERESTIKEKWDIVNDADKTIKELQERLKGRWIDVNEELPQEPGFYNVIAATDSKTSPDVHGFWWDGKNWCFDNHMSQGEPLFTAGWYVDVTHWQKLPL